MATANPNDKSLSTAIEKPYNSWLSGPGVVYSCPWEFKLPSVIGYSMFVASNPLQRVEAPTDFREHQVQGRCEFPTFKPNTVWLTWLGHASCLFTFYGDSADTNCPIDRQVAVQEANTVRVLCDPNFSDFIGPTLLTGSSRHIPSACQVDDLPEIHALCISHNHMDHMDKATLRQLATKRSNIQCFVPVGDEKLMRKFGFHRVVEMKWWNTNSLSVKDLSVTFTPASHWSGRGINDRNCSLWGSFVLESGQHKVFFAGDSGYQDRIFKEIGQEFGPFNLSAIPIGCYKPRDVFSVQHVCPKKAVVIHRDIHSSLSVGIHWGAFRMTTREGLLQPPEDLRKAVRKANLQVDEFQTIKVGASICFPPQRHEGSSNTGRVPAQAAAAQL